MTFFSKLYAYKQSPVRSSLEDFLTELLAQWLRMADEAGYTRRALSVLFKLPDSDHPTGPISWMTQHAIPKGYGKASGRKPDLVASGDGFFFIVENKVAAGFTSHIDEESGYETLQLDLYQTYLDARASRGIVEKGGLCLLTFATPPPADWKGAVCFWSELHSLLRTDLAAGTILSSSAFGFFTMELLKFLEDHGMGSIDLHEGDMIAVPAMRRLETAFGQLKALAVRESTRLLSSPQSVNHLQPCGDRKSDRNSFGAPWFYGEVLTNEGKGFNESAFVAWAGVMVDSVDWIDPLDRDIPEFTVGLAVWCDEASFDGPSESIRNAFQAAVVQRCPGTWEWQRLERPTYGPVMIFSARVPFTDAWRQAQTVSWNDWSAEYFRTHLSALFAALHDSHEEQAFVETLSSWIHQS
ncbi:hypothetical protein NLK61_00530 [Pseudomonas fuscovaginae UPB0736]|uniref:hypothetical protein n=1 Tax=Pseudomonas asplenii TaxID=53407 RepID=UPI000289DC70|nr:hypothetical protein [Pseudomonas fuscovaginae]UUQ65172.1 hypothetical protein NLK61_00530 [Pseudomonas fuscovaginae UPB0736]